jgi:hypothetical protein
MPATVAPTRTPVSSARLVGTPMSSQRRAQSLAGQAPDQRAHRIGGQPQLPGGLGHADPGPVRNQPQQFALRRRRDDTAQR